MKSGVMQHNKYCMRCSSPSKGTFQAFVDGLSGFRRQIARNLPVGQNLSGDLVSGSLQRRRGGAHERARERVLRTRNGFLDNPNDHLGYAQGRQ